MTFAQHIAVWSLILFIAGMAWSAFQHTLRRKRRQRHREAILRDRYY